MKNRIALPFSLLLLGFVGLASAAPPAPSPAANGGRIYKIYCASCHGISGRGDGPVAGALKIPPTDLTRLREHGTFSRDRVAASIDGRRVVRGHGPGGMPVWGMSFQDLGRDSDQSRQVREQIRDLVAYLESIQKK